MDIVILSYEATGKPWSWGENLVEEYPHLINTFVLYIC